MAKINRSQLRYGTKVESEHASTIRFISQYVSKHKKLPPNKSIYTHIALNHLRENPKYYSRLKRAKL